MINNKIYILLLSLSLIILPSGFSSNLSIMGCSSGAEMWKCDQNKICVCAISGDCTDGNLLVYKDTVYNIICLPSIDPTDNIAEINLDLCGNPTGEIKVKANCREGQSLERTVMLYAPVTTTTTTTSTTTTITTTTLAQCSDQEESCSRLSCCPGLECCEDMICRESCVDRGGGINVWLIIVPVVGILSVILAFILLRGDHDFE